MAISQNPMNETSGQLSKKHREAAYIRYFDTLALQIIKDGTGEESRRVSRTLKAAERLTDRAHSAIDKTRDGRLEEEKLTEYRKRCPHVQLNFDPLGAVQWPMTPKDKEKADEQAERNVDVWIGHRKQNADERVAEVRNQKIQDQYNEIMKRKAVERGPGREPPAPENERE